MLEGSSSAANAKAAKGEPCTTPFLLCDLSVGGPDKLGNTVQEILWLGASYAIYSSDKGVYVHFSDCPEEEKDQRKKFTEICPELCELRYLTDQMRNAWWRSARATSQSALKTSGHRGHALYEHNMAQALMLVMEDQVDPAKKIAQQSLTMAVRRVTNDNTIRYVVACLTCFAACIAAGLAFLWWAPFVDADAMKWRTYVVGGMFGAAGAVFSIATRLQAFELKPCNQSGMNYWMSAIRVGLGVIAAIGLLLFANTILADMISKMVSAKDVIPWEVAAILGFIGGFAERLVPNLLRRTVSAIESTDGTPVQAVRSRASHAG